jgi:hypothetical protein
LARQRRAALAQDGRRAQRSRDRVRTPQDGKAGVRKFSADAGDQASRDCGCGCKGERKDSQRPATDLGQFAHQPGAPVKTLGNGKQARSRSKRAAAALGAKPTSRMRSQSRRRRRCPAAARAPTVAQSAASLARQANPKLSGRELAQKVRAQRSSNGGAGERRSARPGASIQTNKRPCRARAISPGRSPSARPRWASSSPAPRSVVAKRPPATSRAPAAPSPAPNTWARTFSAPSASRSGQAVAKVRVSPTSQGPQVTGNEVGRSTKVTGDEPGTCKSVTGTEYLSPNQYEAFCASSKRSPARVRSVWVRPSAADPCPATWSGAPARSPATNSAPRSSPRAPSTPRRPTSAPTSHRRRSACPRPSPAGPSAGPESGARRRSPETSRAAAAWSPATSTSIWPIPGLQRRGQGGASEGRQLGHQQGPVRVRHPDRALRQGHR